MSDSWHALEHTSFALSHVTTQRKLISAELWCWLWLHQKGPQMRQVCLRALPAPGAWSKAHSYPVQQTACRCPGSATAFWAAEGPSCFRLAQGQGLTPRAAICLSEEGCCQHLPLTHRVVRMK